MRRLAMRLDQRGVDDHPLESVKGRAMNSQKKQGDRMGCTVLQRRTGFDSTEGRIHRCTCGIGGVLDFNLALTRFMLEKRES